MNHILIQTPSELRKSNTFDLSREAHSDVNMFRPDPFGLPPSAWPARPLRLGRAGPGMANQPVESQELSDRYLNIRGNPAMLRAMARLKKGRGIAPRRLPTSPTVTDKLLTMERFLATQMTEQGFEQVFLGGKPDIEPNLERFQELERGAEALAMMMRRFEGRTWRGIHHHLTLAALATMRTLYC